MRLFLLGLLLAGCTSEPSHLGNPVLLPVSGLATAVENGLYESRRAQVKATLFALGPAILTDPSAQALLWRRAPVPPAERAAALRDIAGLPNPGSEDWTEAATVAIMVRL